MSANRYPQLQDRSTLVRLMARHGCTYELARHLGCHVASVQRACRRHDIPFPMKAGAPFRPRFEALFDERKLRELWERHGNLTTIARVVGCSQNLVCLRIRQYDWYTGRPHRNRTMAELRRAMEAYALGESQRDVERRMELPTGTLNTHLKRNPEYRIRHARTVMDLRCQRIREVIIRWKSHGESRAESARVFGLSTTRIAKDRSSAYGLALRHFVYGEPSTRTVEEHVRAMLREAVPPERIIRLVDDRIRPDRFEELERTTPVQSRGIRRPEVILPLS